MPLHQILGKKFKQHYRQRPYRTIGFGIVLFMGVIFLLNRLILSSIREPIRESAKAMVDAPPVVYKEKSRPAKRMRRAFIGSVPKDLVAEDPAKYSITVERQYDVPKSQMQWDFEMKRTLDHVFDTRTRRGEETFVNIKKTPEEFNKQLKTVENRIRRLEKIQKDSPQESVRKRLQNLYMLKSTMVVLQGRIVEEPPARKEQNR